WNIGEQRAEIQDIRQIFAEDAMSVPSRAVRMSVVHAGIAVHGDRGSRLRDLDRDIARGRRVIRTSGKSPMCDATGSVSKSGGQVYESAQVFAEDTMRGAGRAVSMTVVNASVAVHAD